MASATLRPFGNANGLNNLVYAGAGNKLPDGGNGTETASYVFATAGVTVCLALTTAQATGGSGSDILRFSEYLSGNADDVVIETDPAPGFGGRDTVYASVSTTLSANVENLRLVSATALNGTGNAVDNTICAGNGNNVIDAAGGNDTISYVYQLGGVNVSLANAAAQNTIGSGTDTLSNLENIIGSNFADNLTGTAGANVIEGWLGADIMIGGDGSDLYYVDNTGDNIIKANANPATGGSDLVYATAASLSTGQATGGSGTDTLLNVEHLIGSGYADTLTGNTQANSLTGGTGTDIFVLNSVLASDTISDFASGSDKVRISQAGIAIGNGNTTVENATTIAGPGGFAATAELVIISGNIAGALSTASAAAAIGSAGSAYGIGQKALFVVDNGAASAAYLFTAADANAVVSAAELTLLATLNTAGCTVPGHWMFGG